MILKKHVFNHSGKTYESSLNISEESKINAREKIIFASAFNFFKHKQFEDILKISLEDIPKKYTTITGDLEKALELIDDEYEYTYALLTFTKTHDLVKIALLKYNINHLLSFLSEDALNKMMSVDIEKEKKMINKIKNDKYSELKSQNDSHIISLIPSNLIKRFELIKNNLDDFDTYIKDLKNKNYFILEETKNNFADNIINNIFKSDKNE